MAKHTETDFNVIIGTEYNKVRSATENGISYLKDKINVNPDEFDNEFRNMDSYVKAQIEVEIK